MQASELGGDVLADGDSARTNPIRRVEQVDYGVISSRCQIPEPNGLVSVKRGNELVTIHAFPWDQAR